MSKKTDKPSDTPSIGASGATGIQPGGYFSELLDRAVKSVKESGAATSIAGQASGLPPR